MKTIEPGDKDPHDDNDLRSDADTRRHGLSSVVEGRNRSKLVMIAAFVVIMTVVGFLFVTGGKGGQPPSSAKPKPRIATATTAPPVAPVLPPLPPAPTVPPGFPPPPVPGQAQNENDSDGKENARRHAPMLIYDVSGSNPQSAAKPQQVDDVQSLLAARLLKSDGADAAASSEDTKSGTPSEGHADRTAAFGKKASEQQTSEAVARRITLANRVGQGKMLSATLETALSSDLPGKLRAVVSSDIWSEDGSQRLILRGSRLIGEYRSGVARGQTRVFVIWTRLLEPDGTDVAIGSPGTDDLGRAGLTGGIDRHFAERFGASVLLSLIGSTTTASQGGNSAVVDTSQGFSKVAQESLQDSINIPPTITVPQGSPVQVFVGRDLIFDRAPSTNAG